MICNRNFDVATAGQECAGFVIKFNIARRNVHGAAGRHRFARIDHERVDHLLDLRWINFGWPKVRRDVHFRPQIGTVEREMRRLRQQLGYSHNLLHGRAAFREGEQLTRHVGRFLRRL